VVILAGCDAYEVLGDLGETGWVTDEAPSACAAAVVGVLPTSGQADWFRDDPLQVQVEGEEASAAVAHLSVTLLDRAGRAVEVAVAASEAATDRVVVTPTSPLEPASSYTLRLTDCAATVEVPFRTSPLGLPLEGGPATLRDATYELGLDDPSLVWVQPEGMGALLGSFFNTPILLGVRWADDASLELMGAQGVVSQGATFQDTAFPTWGFPTIGFDAAPRFRVEAERVDLVITGFELPIYDFVLSGTFAPDGSLFGGGTLAGLGDTRATGGAIGQAGRPEAMCNLAAGVGVTCEPCPDGLPLCLRVEVRSLQAREVPGLTLIPVGP
jgi:hypothetical protein